MLNVVTVSRETGDKKNSVLHALLCYNACSVTNHIADFALLILYFAIIYTSNY